MRKGGLCALMISLPLALSACGTINSGSDDGRTGDVARALQEEYQALESCEMTARLRCDWENETADYTLRCHWNEAGTSSVEVLEPELLTGICAELEAPGRKCGVCRLVRRGPHAGKSGGAGRRLGAVCGGFFRVFR